MTDAEVAIARRVLAKLLRALEERPEGRGIDRARATYAANPRLTAKDLAAAVGTSCTTAQLVIVEHRKNRPQSLPQPEPRGGRTTLERKAVDGAQRGRRTP